MFSQGDTIDGVLESVESRGLIIATSDGQRAFVHERSIAEPTSDAREKRLAMFRAISGGREPVRLRAEIIHVRHPTEHVRYVASMRLLKLREMMINFPAGKCVTAKIARKQNSTLLLVALNDWIWGKLEKNQLVGKKAVKEARFDTLKEGDEITVAVLGNPHLQVELERVSVRLSEDVAYMITSHPAFAEQLMASKKHKWYPDSIQLEFRRWLRNQIR